MANYFSHDYDARNDPKMQRIMMELGLEGVGLFWCLVEIMYEQEGKLSLSDCDQYAFALRTDKEKIHKLIEIVFKNDEKMFWSESVLHRLKLRFEKSQKAKKSAQKRWSKNAKAMRSHSDGNAIKESKVNINKKSFPMPNNWENFSLNELKKLHSQLIEAGIKYTSTTGPDDPRHVEALIWKKENLNE